MEFEVITTERLFLKKLTPAIIDTLFENYSEKEIKNQLGLSSDEEFMLEKEKKEGGYVTYNRTVLPFLMVLKENNETIGRCGYHNWYTDHRKAEIGYIISKNEYKQKGYMSETLKAILEYGFNDMNLNRIEACIGPGNFASLNLVKKYMFKQEGYLRQHYIKNNEIQDSLIFSLLKEEYEQSQ
jgi:ribosomal-protein-alanine N-acetyltransferase